MAHGALGVFEDLAEGGLADVKIGRALEMLGRDFGFGIHNLGDPCCWRYCAVICASSRVKSCCQRAGAGADHDGGAGMGVGTVAASFGQARIQPAIPLRSKRVKSAGSAAKHWRFSIK